MSKPPVDWSSAVAEQICTLVRDDRVLARFRTQCAAFLDEKRRDEEQLAAWKRRRKEHCERGLHSLAEFKARTEETEQLGDDRDAIERTRPPEDTEKTWVFDYYQEVLAPDELARLGSPTNGSMLIGFCVWVRPELALSATPKLTVPSLFGRFTGHLHSPSFGTDIDPGIASMAEKYATLAVIHDARFPERPPIDERLDFTFTYTLATTFEQDGGWGRFTEELRRRERKARQQVVMTLSDSAQASLMEWLADVETDLRRYLEPAGQSNLASDGLGSATRSSEHQEAIAANGTARTSPLRSIGVSTNALVDAAVLALSKCDTWRLYDLPPNSFDPKQLEGLLRILDERRLIEMHLLRMCGPNGPFDHREPRQPQRDVWFGPARWYSPSRVNADYRWTDLFKKYSPESTDAPEIRLTESGRACAAELELGGKVAGQNSADFLEGRSATVNDSALDKPHRYILRLEGDHWMIHFGDQQAHFTNSKGMQIIARLLRYPNPTIPTRAFELVTGKSIERSKEQSSEEIVNGIEGGSSFPESTDTETLGKLRTRLAELDVEIDEANIGEDDAEVEKLELEREGIRRYIKDNTGLGGRMRRLGNSPNERARKAVRAAIHRSLSKIKRASPNLSLFVTHIERSIKTEGCCYAYRPAESLNWLFE